MISFVVSVLRYFHVSYLIGSRAEEEDVETLRNTSLAELVEFFNTYVHPDSAERRKMSVHACSQIVPSTPASRFSVAASEAFLTLLKSHGVPVDDAQYRQLSSAEPPLEAVRAFWTDSFGKTPGLQSADKEMLLNAIDELARTHAATPLDSGKAELRQDAVVNLIEDIARFKASLPLGPAAVPVQESLHEQ